MNCVIINIVLAACDPKSAKEHTIPHYCTTSWAMCTGLAAEAVRESQLLLTD